MSKVAALTAHQIRFGYTVDGVSLTEWNVDNGNQRTLA